jgi:hypothetical protein
MLWSAALSGLKLNSLTTVDILVFVCIILRNVKSFLFDFDCFLPDLTFSGFKFEFLCVELTSGLDILYLPLNLLIFFCFLLVLSNSSLFSLESLNSIVTL